MRGEASHANMKKCWITIYINQTLFDSVTNTYSEANACGLSVVYLTLNRFRLR